MTAEVVAVERYEQPHETAAVVLWGTNEPRAMTERMSAIADAMADVVKQRRLTVRIGSNEYVKSEGWSMVGAMIGVFPHPRAVEEIREGETLVGFRATVDLVTRDGNVVGGAVALCTIGEEKWADRDWNQLASMAQTRATAKAYRQTLGFIMPMAGYAPTPAEEMDGIGERHVAPQANGSEPRPMQPRAQASGPQQFRNVGELLTKAIKDLKLERKQVFEVAGLKPNAAAVELEKYEGGLSGLWAALERHVRGGEESAQPPLEGEVVGSDTVADEPTDYIGVLIEKATAEFGLTVAEVWRLLPSSPDDLKDLVGDENDVELYLNDLRARLSTEDASEE